MNRLHVRLNELWQRFWLYQFRNLCPQPTPWAKMLMAIEKLRIELGECLAPAMNHLAHEVYYWGTVEWAIQERRET